MSRLTFSTTAIRMLTFSTCAFGVFSGCSLRQKNSSSSEEPSQSPVVVDGGMSTGGGMLFGTAANPWFLENKSTVTYCIDLDAEHFPVKDTVLKTSIQRSIQFWKDSFSNANYPLYADEELSPYKKILIATQIFEEKKCDEPNIDLRFLFGKASSQQLSKIPNLDKTIAVAVRETYDNQTLTGTGFIYLAAQTGPLRPANSSLAESLWSVCNGCVVEATLMHELGHVFGVPHIDGGTSYLMSETFVERLTNKATSGEIANINNSNEWLEKLRATGSVFSFPKSYSHIDCNVNSSYKFFGDLRNDKCMHLTFENDKVTLYSSIDQKAAKNLLGEITQIGPTESKAVYSSSEDNDLIRIRIPAEQKIFQKLPERAYKHFESGSSYYELFGPGPQSRSFSAVYVKNQASEQKPVLIKLMPQANFEIIGEIDGVIKPLISRK